MLFNLFRSKKSEKKKNAQLLRNFVNSNNGISAKESVNNLEQGILELRIPFGNKFFAFSNGLLITNNGYFLTANHCVDHDLIRGFVICSNKNKSKIEKVCARSKKYDLALCKADFSDNSFALNYKIGDLDKLNAYSPVMLVSRKEGILKKSYGFLNGFSCDPFDIDFKYFDQLNLSLSSGKGTSGGSLVSLEGELLGFVSCGDGKLFTSVAKISRAKEMINFYADNLELR